MKRIVPAMLVLTILVTSLLTTGFSQKKSAKVAATKVTINIALANNPISQGLATNAKKYYKPSGVKVNIVVLPENDLRQKQTTEAASGGTTYDMYYIGPYECSYWAKDGWLENLEPYFSKMSASAKAKYARSDLIKGMADSLKYNKKAYALPFYGEGSFTMYNKKLFKAKGLTMPQNPTWDQIYTLAKKVNDPSKGIVGITMRGESGWGMSGAPFDTIVNAFGAQWYNMKWKATVNTTAMKNAWKMYKKLLVDAGQKDITSYTYNECIALMQSDKCGIYYDATSIAPPLEGKGSKIAGHVGYVMAPHEVKKSNCGWLWCWAMGINPKTTAAKKQAVFNYMIWATSKDYIKLAYSKDKTGSTTPCASRASTYALAGYKNTSYAAETLKALKAADFTKPAINKTPYVGLQYIAIPEFADLGDKMTQNLAAYVTGKMSLDKAISSTQTLFNTTAKNNGYQK